MLTHSDIVLTHSDIALMRSDIRIKDASLGKFSLRRIFSFSAAARHPFCRKAKYNCKAISLSEGQYHFAPLFSHRIPAMSKPAFAKTRLIPYNENRRA
ncbi:MAG: hypothetical protein IJ138_00490 [Clostridia bacterium]|nr:hypothetical protein [Clostridia bacterium]